jgi:hypothetical protein
MVVVVAEVDVLVLVDEVYSVVSIEVVDVDVVEEVIVSVVEVEVEIVVVVPLDEYVILRFING